MKKMMMVIAFLFIVMSMSAQTYKFKTTSFAYKAMGKYGWTQWTNWERTEMLVVISLDRKVITVYSNTPQEYDIVEYLGEKTDSNSESMKLLCVNEDGVRCHIRLRMLNDGKRQLYVDFSNAMWVYNLAER